MSNSFRTAIGVRDAVSAAVAATMAGAILGSFMGRIDRGFMATPSLAFYVVAHYRMWRPANWRKLPHLDECAQCRDGLTATLRRTIPVRPPRSKTLLQMSLSGTGR